jgi:hypothetical protein
MYYLSSKQKYVPFALSRKQCTNPLQNSREYSQNRVKTGEYSQTLEKIKVYYPWRHKKGGHPYESFKFPSMQGASPEGGRSIAAVEAKAIPLPILVHCTTIFSSGMQIIYNTCHDTNHPS